MLMGRTAGTHAGKRKNNVLTVGPNGRQRPF